jgi:hypothetical protein
MAYYFEMTGCRLAIQLCVGYFPNGRAQRRTISFKNIRVGASADDIAAIVRAIAPLLDYPIMKVRLVRKYRLVEGNGEAGASPLPSTSHPLNVPGAIRLPASLITQVLRYGRSPPQVHSGEISALRSLLTTGGKLLY